MASIFTRKCSTGKQNLNVHLNQIFHQSLFNIQFCALNINDVAYRYMQRLFLYMYVALSRQHSNLCEQ